MGLAPTVDAVRLSLHVFGAAVWVGGQVTIGGLVPTARRLGPEVPGAIARAFARFMWPAYVLLLATGIWNVTAASAGQPHSWKVVLGVKIAVVLFAGLAVWLHTRSTTPRSLAVWGAIGAVASIAALVMGVFLAG